MSKQSTQRKPKSPKKISRISLLKTACKIGRGIGDDIHRDDPTQPNEYGALETATASDDLVNNFDKRMETKGGIDDIKMRAGCKVTGISLRKSFVFHPQKEKDYHGDRLKCNKKQQKLVNMAVEHAYECAQLRLTKLYKAEDGDIG